MFSRNGFLIFLLVAIAAGATAKGACVWKVTRPGGGVIYLGGSIHGLASTDYPLPSAYNRAFDASSALVIEDDPNVSRYRAQKFYKSGFYRGTDSLRSHVDPRTYDYLRRVFGAAGMPESEMAKCKPWMLIMMLWSGGTNDLGIEAYLIRRANANHMPIYGLETFQEHGEIISGMSDKQAELVLLATFIPEAPGTDLHKKMLSAWRRGDADALARFEADTQRDLPSFADRLIGARNRDWIPKIERYIRDRRTCFIVAGAAHMGGPNGVLTLLRQRGYRIEQL